MPVHSLLTPGTSGANPRATPFAAADFLKGAPILTLIPPHIVAPEAGLVKPAPPVIVVQSPAESGPVVQRLDEDVVVTSETSHYDPLNRVVTFNRGVVARYGGTVVRAERLTVYLAETERRAVASGSVTLDDPDVHLAADDLEFTWKQGGQGGDAKNVTIKIVNVTLRAERAQLSPDKWELFNVAGTNSRTRPPLLEVRSPHATIYPGRVAHVERPSLYILGHRIITIPTRNFDLNPRTEGFTVPSISYRRGEGLGVTWQSGFLLDPLTNLQLRAGAFPQSKPGFGVTLARSLLSEEQTTTVITPFSDLGERFRFGFLETIESKTPEEEMAYLKRQRKVVAVDSLWNEGTADRISIGNFDKALEGVYQIGGRSGDVGLLGQARLQSIRSNGGPFISRGVFIGSAGVGPYPVGRNLRTFGRLDTNLIVGANQYGWLRGILGVAYQPLSQVTLSAGGFASQDFGTPDFSIDRLYAKNGIVLRSDFDLGPTKFSYMTKWDRDRRWFDREYTASQVVGSLEPFVVYRKFPREYSIGIRFRLDEFYAALRRRDFRRTKSVISPDTSPPRQLSP